MKKPLTFHAPDGETVLVDPKLVRDVMAWRDLDGHQRPQDVTAVELRAGDFPPSRWVLVLGTVPEVQLRLIGGRVDARVSPGAAGEGLRVGRGRR